MSLSKTSKETLEGEKDDWEDADDASSSSGNLEASSTNVSTTDTNQTGTTDDDFQSIKNALTKRETQQVFRLRVLVMFVLIAAATSISVVIFHLERSTQVEEFEADFYGVAEKVIEALQQVTESISAVGGLAVMATVDAQNQVLNASLTNSESVFVGWPFVTIDAFQERANNARSLSGSMYVSLNPIVQPNQLNEWEKFVQSNANSWM